MKRLLKRRHFLKSAIIGALNPISPYHELKASSRQDILLSPELFVFDDYSEAAAEKNFAVVSAAFRQAARTANAKIMFIPPRVAKFLYLSCSIHFWSPYSQLEVDFGGLDICFISKSPVVGKSYFSLGAQSGTGSSVIIRNATVGMNRPSIRTADSDLIRINGFDFVEADLAISCADNMGLTVGRSATHTAPRFVKVKLRCLGRQFDRPHSHAPIGDTAVWLPNGAENIDFEIDGQGTGDDFVFVGPLPRFHIAQTSASRTIRVNICDCATGIKLACENVNIVGSVRNTVGPAIAIVPGLFARDRVVKADGCRVRVRVDRAGQLEAGDIGQRIIPLQKNSGSALWVYGSVSNLDIDGSVFSNLRGGAILLQPSGSGIANVHGRVAIQNMPVDRSGQALPALGKTAVVRRSGAPTASVSDTDVSATVRGVHGPTTLGFIDGTDHANRVTVRPAD